MFIIIATINGQNVGCFGPFGSLSGAKNAAKGYRRQFKDDKRFEGFFVALTIQELFQNVNEI